MGLNERTGGHGRASDLGTMDGWCYEETPYGVYWVLLLLKNFTDISLHTPQVGHLARRTRTVTDISLHRRRR